MFHLKVAAAQKDQKHIYMLLINGLYFTECFFCGKNSDYASTAFVFCVMRSQRCRRRNHHHHHHGHHGHYVLLILRYINVYAVDFYRATLC